MATLLVDGEYYEVPDESVSTVFGRDRVINNIRNQRRRENMSGPVRKAADTVEDILNFRWNPFF